MRGGRIVGIDPGLAGGLGMVEIAADGTLSPEPFLIRTPSLWVQRGSRRRREYDVAAMRGTLEMAIGFDERGDVLVGLEAAGPRPQQGVASTFRTGMGFGLWLGLVVGRGLAYVVVPPAAWKRHHGLLGSDKRASRLRATERFPSLGVIGPAEEGAAEALLLATYVAARDGAGALRASSNGG